jgi:hypothetical protein
VLATACCDLVEEEQAAASDLPEQVVRLEQALAALDTDERRLLDAVLGGISSHLIQERAAEIQRRRNGLRIELDAVQARLTLSSGTGEVVQRAEELAARCRMELAAAKEDPARLKRLYQGLLRIQLFPRAEPVVATWVQEVLPTHTVAFPR